MQKETLKNAILRILDNLPEEKLEELYAGLKVYEDKDPDTIQMAHILNKILKEDENLLKRLAQ